MALEYLEGEPLSARLARGPLPWREAVEYGIQVADAYPRCTSPASSTAT